MKTKPTQPPPMNELKLKRQVLKQQNNKSSEPARTDAASSSDDVAGSL